MADIISMSLEETSKQLAGSKLCINELVELLAFQAGVK